VQHSLPPRPVIDDSPPHVRAGDYRECVIAELISVEADLRAEIRALEDRLVEALVDGHAYRLVAQQAIHAQHATTRECARLRARLAQLADEYRRLREQILREGVVAS
jgi:hypothetical protein